MKKSNEKLLEAARIGALSLTLAFGIDQAISDVTDIQGTKEQAVAQQKPILTQGQQNLANFGMSGL